MKKLFTLFLLTLLPLMASADAVEIDGIYYNLIAKGKVAEVTSNPNNYSGDVVIPQSVEFQGESYTVTSILGGAFSDCFQLSSITIPSSIKKIGLFTTWFSGGEAPDYSIKISDLEAWLNVDFEENDYSYPPFGAPYHLYLNGEELVNLEIPETVSKIKCRAFSDCVSLETVTIPSTVSSIGEHAFDHCYSLNSIIIPHSISSISNGVFSDCI